MHGPCPQGLTADHSRSLHLCGMQGGTLCSLGAELEPHVFYSDLSAADSLAFV